MTASEAKTRATAVLHAVADETDIAIVCNDIAPLVEAIAAELLAAANGRQCPWEERGDPPCPVHNGPMSKCPLRTITNAVTP